MLTAIQRQSRILEQERCSHSVKVEADTMSSQFLLVIV